MHLQIFIGEQWLQETADTPCSWALRDARGQKLRDGHNRLAELPAASKTSIVLAASCAFLTSLRLPTRQTDKMRRLAPYALEEQAMADPEHIHVALGSFRPDGAINVAVIDRDWLTRLLGRLKTEGIKPQSVQIETLSAHYRDHEWAVVLKEDGGFVRTGAEAGLALDLASDGMPPLGLQLAIEDAGEDRPRSIVVHYQEEHLALPDMAQWTQLLGVPTARGVPWEWSEQQHAAPLNLLQGTFSPSANLALGWQKLRTPCLLLALMAVIHGGLSAVDWWRMTHEQKQLTQQMEQDFRQSFPEAHVVVDAPLQFQRNLQDLRAAAGQLSADDFLPLLAKAAPLLVASNSSHVEQLRFEQGALRIDMTLPSAQGVQDLRSRLAGAGLKVEKVDIQNEASGVTAHFLVKA